MVNESAQLYTIEGVAAGVIMLFTAFIVLSTTTVYAPGDTHLSEMQLEQMAYDALAMMDTPDSWGSESDLEIFVRTNDTAGFNNEFLKLMGNSAYTATLRPAAEMFPDEIQYQATVYYRTGTSTVNSYHFVSSSELIAHEPGITTTRLVAIPGRPIDAPADVRNEDQVVLLEVLVWRG